MKPQHYPPTAQIPAPGQESVWDYPRPPRLEPANRHIRIVHAGIVLAETTRAHRILETSHPPVYYIPQDDIQMAYLQPVAGKSSFCEWKGVAMYYDLVLPSASVAAAAWSYHRLMPAYLVIKDALAFYAGKLDACYVDGEQVTPQPGSFYGGWINSWVCGPFKGEAGSMGW
ncbi:MAG: DUF427 domain-containing protein [Bacteroidia bacterium]|nr:DUF427 domain-containing protein [Bacteroidia bacterium]